MERVDWVGQPVVAIVAESAAAALDAIERVEIDFELLSAADENEAFRHRWMSGGIETTDPNIAFVAKVRVEHAKLAPTSMEPRLTLVDCDASGQITAWISTQAPQRARVDLSKVLAIAEDQIRVICPDVGGAFGGKASIYPEDIIVTAAAVRLRQPVKWVGTRSEEFLSATHGRGARSRGELAVDANGKFLQLKAEFDLPLGAKLPFSGMVPARNAGRILPGPYAMERVDISISGKQQHTSPVGIYRGAGRPEAAMLLERLVEEAARLLNVDPLELRLKNVLRADQLPYRSATGELIDSCDFQNLIAKAREEFGYSDMRREQKRRRRKREIIGIGSAAYIEPCGFGGESASVEIGGDGRVTAITGSSAQGQGRQTAFAQIVADVLQVDPARVSVLHGDTQTAPRGIGALASRSTAIGGSALYVATEKLREQARSRAASRMDCDVDQVVLTPAGFRDLASGKTIELHALAPPAGAGGMPFESLKVDIDYVADGEAWSSGCCVAGVSIDPETGETRIEKIVWVDDAGAVVNPMLVRGQLWGGLMQGLGEALSERLVYDQAGQLLTASLMDYAVPRARDIPPVVFHSIENPSLFNALGAKGIGEAGCIGIPAAIVNAVLDALSPLGIRHVDMPLTSGRIWSAMQHGTNRSEG